MYYPLLATFIGNLLKAVLIVIGMFIMTRIVELPSHVTGAKSVKLWKG